MFTLKINKKFHSDKSRWKYKRNFWGNASNFNEEDDNEINVNKGDMASIPEQKDMDVRIQRLAKSEESHPMTQRLETNHTKTFAVYSEE